jgi:hypothetical protein
VIVATNMVGRMEREMAMIGGMVTTTMTNRG